jgi:hypothetical protein
VLPSLEIKLNFYSLLKRGKLNGRQSRQKGTGRAEWERRKEVSGN